MKGLLIKDFCLTCKNKKLIGILVFMAVFMFAMQGEDMGGFIISFVTMLGGTFVLSTITTDEFDKSSMFLMTMPIKRSTYALEKYVFSFGCSLICWVASTIICCIINRREAVETVLMAVALLFVISFFQMLMIPVQLKFGGENGRMVLMGMVIAIFGLTIIIRKFGNMVFGEGAVQLWYQGILRFIDGLSSGIVMVVAVTGWILCFILSVRVSIRTIEKREY
ncbi:MAG: ABC-2 transporter permease [Lachnospiraceae bacterium]|nr:ABC-2 transporter permease [Lachnospiraceae bacterium]